MNHGRVLVVGACGRMGEQVRKWVGAHEALVLGAALEVAGHPRIGDPLEDDITLQGEIEEALQSADVVIDFTVPEATLHNLRAAAEAGDVRDPIRYAPLGSHQHVDHAAGQRTTQNLTRPESGHPVTHSHIPG